MNILAFLLQNLPAIIQGVVGVERAIRAPGATKKKIVMSAVDAAVQAGEQIPESHVQAVSAVVDKTVAALNQAGVFEKPVAAPAQ